MSTGDDIAFKCPELGVIEGMRPIMAPGWAKERVTALIKATEMMIIAE